MVYAVGWRSVKHGNERLLAETEEDIEKDKTLWEALGIWNNIAAWHGRPDKKTNKNGMRPRRMFCYAHNNARFGGVAVIHSILANSTDPLEDLPVSNGKFISFRWKTLSSGTVCSLR